MDAIKNLLGNEHGLLAILLLITTAVFVALGKMSIDEWKNYSQFIFGAWGLTHGAVSIADAVGSKSTPPTDAPKA